ncbi:MAG TPA: antitoxin Xre/MbcA/ParS toxin-binding domain-containing protein [Zeimonas sp.]
MAVQRVLEWLFSRHRDATQTAIAELLFEDLWPADGPDPEEVDEDLISMIVVNVNEWFLAEGEIEVGGQWRDVHEYALGSRGPALSAKQRAYIAQLAATPLKLYTVTQVRRGEGLTLVDALDPESAPVVVRERTGSETMVAGLLLGCRVVQIEDHFELSGALYPFSMLGASVAIEAVRTAMEVDDLHPEDRAYEVGLAIMREWLRQLFDPVGMPGLVDASTGDPLLFVIDHYRIIDDAALVDALDSSAELQGDDDGWVRAVEADDGMMRPSATIERGKSADRLTVFYRTQRLADEGRAWFEALASASVEFLTREISDPGALVERARAAGTAPPAPQTAADLGMSPEALSQAIEQALRNSYANWADEPIPALHGQSPREAMRTPGGLERVKGLLRSYEAGEAQSAAQAGRSAISFHFLWDELGIEPDR